MNEEIYDPDCGACERAQQDYAELERVTDDLAALVRQLVRSLRKAAPDNELADKALDYLKRKGLQGSPLRHNAGNVWPMVKAGKLDEVASYCRADVERTRAIYKRLMFEAA